MNNISIAFLTIVFASFAFSSEMFRTNNIHKWGYAKDNLVLILKNGDQLLIAPKNCSKPKFPDFMKNFIEVELKIHGKKFHEGTSFSLVGQDNNGETRVKCEVKNIFA